MGEPNTIADSINHISGPGAPTFKLLDAIVTILGGVKQTFWPVLSSSGEAIFPYGSGTDGVKLTAATALNAAGAGGHDPLKTPGGIHAVQVDGTAAADVVTAVDNANFTFGNATVDVAFSLHIWVMPQEALGTIRSLLAKFGTTAALAEEYDLRFDATGQPILELHDPSVPATEIATGVGGAVITPFAWNHVVATYDGNEADPRIHLYINGVDANAAGLSTETGAYVAMEDTTAILMIGARDAAATAAQVFQGYWALPAVVGKELTAAEVKQLYSYGRLLLGLD